MELEFVTLDVFTSKPFEGNPLAVVKVPSQFKNQLSQPQKQRIAREFNLSETVFLHEKTSGANEWVVDIFTVTDELPFAGHPTIGTATYVLNINPEKVAGGDCVLRTKAGPINILQNAYGGVGADIPQSLHIHKRTIGDWADSSIELSANPQIREAEKRAPLVSIVKGMTFLLVRLDSLELLAQPRATPRDLSFRKLLDEGWDAGFVGKYYYVLDRDGTSGITKIRSRMLEDMMEDPATGSAACALCGYLALADMGLDAGSDGDIIEPTVGQFEINQGVEMGRRSVISVEVKATKDRRSLSSIRLSGTAVKVMEGKIKV